MKSVLLVTYFGAKNGGGIATATAMIAEELSRRGWRVIIAATEPYRIKGVDWKRLPKVRGILNFKMRDKVLIKTLNKIIEEEKPEIVHATDVRYVGWAALCAAQKNHLPITVDFRDYWFCCLKGDLLYQNEIQCDGMKNLSKCIKCLCKSGNSVENLLLKKWTANKFHYFHERLSSLPESQQNLPVSQYVAQKMDEFGLRRKQTVMYDTILSPPVNQSEMTEFKKRLQLQDKFVVLFVGKFIYHRGIDVLHKLLSDFAQDDELKKIAAKHKIHFLLVGNGEKFNQIKRHKEESQWQHVTLTGQIASKQVAMCYQLADIFLFPSLLNEPFSRAVLEAVFAHKPIITSNLGGLPEVVKNDVNGFLIDSTDVNMITKKIITLAENENLRNKMSEANKKIEEKFNSENYFSKLESIYQQAATDSKHGKQN